MAKDSVRFRQRGTFAESDLTDKRLNLANTQNSDRTSLLNVLAHQNEIDRLRTRATLADILFDRLPPQSKQGSCPGNSGCIRSVDSDRTQPSTDSKQQCVGCAARGKRHWQISGQPFNVSAWAHLAVHTSQIDLLLCNGSQTNPMPSGCCDVGWSLILKWKPRQSGNAASSPNRTRHGDLAPSLRVNVIKILHRCPAWTGPLHSVRAAAGTRRAPLKRRPNLAFDPERSIQPSEPASSKAATIATLRTKELPRRAQSPRCTQLLGEGGLRLGWSDSIQHHPQ